VRALLVFGKWNTGTATPDADHNFVDQIHARMWKRHTAFHGTRVRLLTRQHLFEKSVRLGNVSCLREQLHDLANRVRWFSGAQPKDDVVFIQQICEGDRHGGGEIYWIIRETQLSSNCRPGAPLGAPRIVATQDAAVAPKEERTVSFQRSIYDPGYVNAMSHFYRGELGRIMVWRQRLDMTTNWAITSSTAIITIAFSTRGVPHIIFFFNLAIVAVLLWIESRRYRFYDAFRARVRMLEAHFLVPMVMENRELLQGEWKKLVSEDLILPCFKITKLEAIGRRMKRNYMFIFILILIAWLTKIFLHATEPITDVVSFYHALRIGHIPSWFVALIFVSTFVSVISITIYVSKRSSGEISEFGTHRSLWRI
jgi:uncharacterized membrane protein